MRWPFRRTTPEPPPVAEGNGVASGSGAAEVGRGWESLPPLQRSTEDLAPIAPSASFRESLSAHQDPRFLAPLGHSLTLNAPAGEIGNYAKPAAVEQRQEFALPSSAAAFGTPASSVSAPLQRAADVDSEPAVRTFSLPSAMSASPGELPPIEARSTPVVAPPVVSRAVETPQAHADHTHDHSPGQAVTEHAAVEQLPLVGAVDSVGQSPFVSALGGPPVESAVQRAVEEPAAGTSVAQRPMGELGVVQRAVDQQAGAARAVGMPVTQRGVADQGSVQRATDGESVAQRAAEGRPMAQRAAEGESLTQRAVEGEAMAQRGLVGEAVMPLSLGSGAVGQAGADGAEVVQRSADRAAAAQGGQVLLPGGDQRVVPPGTFDSGSVQRVSVAPSAAGGLSGGPAVSPAKAGEVTAGGAVSGGVTLGAGTSGGAAGRQAQVGAVLQRVGGAGAQTPAEVGLVGDRGLGLQRQAGLDAAPQGVADVASQRSVGGRQEPGVGVQRAAVGTAGEPVRVQRVGVGPAELLWPPPAAARHSSVVPLSSSVPLTAPEVQRPVMVGSVPPAVQRVVYDHPGLRTPSSSRTASVTTAQPGLAQAAAQPEAEQVLSWSAGESFHTEPAVQRAESKQPEPVRAVSLQQMFSGHAAPQHSTAEPEDAVQRDEAPAEAPAPQAVPAAPASAVQAAAPVKPVSAAEVEELAKRLYEPLTAKLRAELWLDRERSGRMTDRWH